jgi:hypothetical protein
MTTTTRTAPVPTTGSTDASRYAGIAFLVLFMAGFVIWSLPPYVYEGSTLEEFAAAHDDSGRSNLISVTTFILWPLAGLALFVAIARIRRGLDLARGGTSPAGRVATLGAVVLAAGFTIAAAASSAGAHVAGGSSDGGFPPEATAGYALELLAGQVFSVSLWGAAVVLLAVGVAGRRGGHLPGWLLWTGIVIAPLMPVAFMLFMLPLLVFLLWLAAVTFMVRTPAAISA